MTLLSEQTYKKMLVETTASLLSSCMGNYNSLPLDKEDVKEAVELARQILKECGIDVMDS